MSVRRIALEALLDITERGAYANLRLKEARRVAPESARWITAAVYETLDHLIYIDFLLAAFAKGSKKPVIRGILRLGAAQMLYMQVPPRAVCNESVNLCREMGKGALTGYVNGVLRALARAIEGNALPPIPAEPSALRMSIQYSWPLWLVERWMREYGEEETARLLASPPASTLTIRPQPPFTAAELEEELRKRKIPYTRGRWAEDCFHLNAGLDLEREPLFSEGRIAVQSESAMLACRACGIGPDKTILDACAAPGGKTAYLAALAGGMANITAWELHPHRKELLDATLSRLGVQAETMVQDASVPVPELMERFDVVLIDAPCSGLGVSNPDARYQKTAEDIAAICETQSKILDACAGYVKPGGALVYATCTIGKEENEDQIAAFFARHPEFKPDSLAPYLPEGLPGLERGMVQLLPHREKTEGFFIARLKRG